MAFYSIGEVAEPLRNQSGHTARLAASLRSTETAA